MSEEKTNETSETDEKKTSEERLNKVLPLWRMDEFVLQAARYLEVDEDVAASLVVTEGKAHNLDFGGRDEDGGAVAALILANERTSLRDLVLFTHLFGLKLTIRTIEWNVAVAPVLTLE